VVVRSVVVGWREDVARAVRLEMEDRIGGIVIDGGATCLAGAAATYGEPPAACLPQRSGSGSAPRCCCLRCFIKPGPKHRIRALSLHFCKLLCVP
jgi:hypothetical protein